MQWARANRDRVFDAYASLEEASGGKIINGDLFVTLLPAVDSRPELVHTLDLSDMNYLAMDLYESRVARPDENGANTVLVMIGAPGVGKSTLARSFALKFPHQIHTILDSNGASIDMVRQIVNTAIRNGRSVDVMFVGGDIAGAVGRSVSRYEHDQRVVPASIQAAIHRAAPTTFIQAVQELAQDDVAFLAYNTSTKQFAEDHIGVAQKDLDDPNNNQAGIASLITEAIHGQRVEPSAAEAFAA